MKRLPHNHALRPVAMAAAVTCSMLAFFTTGAHGAERPNFVFVLIDDLGWSDLGCYGNTFHETPNIDRLAAQGMRFTDAYAACPVCSPTRGSLMTGRYPATIGITDFIPGHWRPWAKLVVPEILDALPLEEVTLAEAIKPAGYATCYLGKWHLGGRTHFPHLQGFDTSLVQGGGHFGARLLGPKPEQLARDEYLGEALTDRAVRFIRDHRDEPFFVYLAHYIVHIPLEAKAPLIEKYEAKSAALGGKTTHPTYAAMVEHADRSVGRLMQVLDELNLADNTVFIFFSDNGGLIRRFDRQGPAVTTNAPLRAEKGTVYEGGIRVPAIVRWPGVVEPGSECGVPISSVDFWPTMVQIAQAAPPAGGPIDGESLVPLLEQTAALKRDAIFWHYPHYHHMDPAGAVRAGDWKLIEHFENGSVELFNLRQDIGEKNDLADAMPEKANELRNRLAQWRKSVGAKMPTINPDFDPAKAGQWQRRVRRSPPPRKR